MILVNTYAIHSVKNIYFICLNFQLLWLIKTKDKFFFFNFFLLCLKESLNIGNESHTLEGLLINVKLYDFF